MKLSSSQSIPTETLGVDFYNDAQAFTLLNTSLIWIANKHENLHRFNSAFRCELPSLTLLRNSLLLPVCRLQNYSTQTGLAQSASKCVAWIVNWKISEMLCTTWIRRSLTWNRTFEIIFYGWYNLNIADGIYSVFWKKEIWLKSFSLYL